MRPSNPRVSERSLRLPCRAPKRSGSAPANRARRPAESSAGFSPAQPASQRVQAAKPRAINAVDCIFSPFPFKDICERTCRRHPPQTVPSTPRQHGPPPCPRPERARPGEAAATDPARGRGRGRGCGETFRRQSEAPRSPSRCRHR